MELGILMKNGRCGLCRKDGILHNSHLVPKAAYKLVRDPISQGGRSPMKVDTSSRRAGRTDKQVTAHFLCGACEIKFSKFGETPVSKLWGGFFDFPMLEILIRQGPSAHHQRRAIYASADVPINVVDSLYYFALSIVWRAAVWPTTFAKVNSCKGAIAPPVLTAIEEFLLDPKGRVRDIFMVVDVNTHQALNGIFSFPARMKAAEVEGFQFDLLGFRFMVFVGPIFPSEIQLLMNSFERDILFTTSNHMESSATKQIAKYLYENDIA
jgi:hypothetical protein